MTRETFNCVDCDWPSEWHPDQEDADCHIWAEGHRVQRVHPTPQTAQMCEDFLLGLTAELAICALDAVLCSHGHSNTLPVFHR